MPITPERIQTDFNAIAQFTPTPGSGMRSTFTPAWRQAIDYISSQAQAIGCKVRIDAAGNLHARPSAIAWEAPAWLSGSHINNPHGVIGVLAALEALRSAREDLKVACPMELVVWAGGDVTFGQRLIGSRAYAGQLSAEQLADLKNAQGISYLEAGTAHGVVREKLATDRLGPAGAIGLIEVHIEESSSLWDQGFSVACAIALAGKRNYRCEIIVSAQVPRLSALRAASEAVLALEKIAHELGNDVAISISQFICEPNSPEIPPQRINFSIDLKTPKTQTLATGDQSIRRHFEKIGQSRQVQLSLTLNGTQSPIELDPRVIAKLTKSASAVRLDPLPQTYCGRMHDAFALAGNLPVGLLVVPTTDVSTATTILLETVRDRRLE
ncbi:MAG TPA: hypothetical protein VHD56_14505 [Tepidisphaeraceae bacterium]|nr:hypothetical protein [Tepidisphaeraceae bacterium]